MMLNFITGIDKKKMAGILLISAAVLYLDVAYILKFQIDGIAHMGPQIAKVQKDIDTFQKDSANVETLKKLPPQQLTGPLKNKKFFTPEQIAMVLETLSDVANKNNVKIMQISSAPDVKAKETTKAKPVKGAAEPATQTFLIPIELSADYHHLGSFLSDLDYSRIISSVQELRIKADSTDYLKQEIKIILKTYVKK
ncbi:MAG TPA: hypothetical protein PKL77_08305 [Candidatus Omnitrophota bacterium]|nr:hypothetical protein [Candidatus Omnitrophota bacterium]HPT07955.1 hypothetical protein [Candidatus Omnitrophota bacterium]